MGVTVIFGGQWGSEGKGKATYHFSKEFKVSSAIRVGGPNSGHTIIDDSGKRLVFQILPVSSVIDGVTSVLPAGSYIELEVLQREIQQSNIPDEKLKINPNAVILSEKYKQTESKMTLNQKIGSTESGTGAAVLARISRDQDVMLAKHEKSLEKYICDTNEFLRTELNQNREVIIEGTQGFGLSLLHSSEYPFVTSRDTSAAGFLSEAGLSPLDVTNIIMVLRAFPIRVAGNSGPLPNEITWDNVKNLAHSQEPIIEYTTVTKRVRRVAAFDEAVVRKAMTMNRPNIVVVNHCDYFDYSINNKPYLSEIAELEVSKIEQLIGRIDYIGTGDRTLFRR